MEINWQAPPATAVRPGKRRGGPFAEIAAALRAKPGDWAIVSQSPDVKTNEAARNLANRIERGLAKAFAVEDESGSFEAMSEGTTVWARFVANLGDDEYDEGDED